MDKKDTKNIDREKLCYDLLENVFIDGGYSTVSLNNALKETPPDDKAYVTRLFYGVLEKSVQFDYIIKALTAKLPKKEARIILKIGLYLTRYFDMPAYAAIDKTVELTKLTPKGALAGFVNAFLRKSLDFKLPDNDLSVVLSYPNWLIERLKKRYSTDFIKQMLAPADNTLTHIRHNPLKILQKDFEGKLKDFKPSLLGYYVNRTAINRLKKDEYTVQSLSSMLAVNAYLSDKHLLNKPPQNALDLCAAPGGKAVYLKQLSPKTNVVCGDIHPHRAELVRKYAHRMGVNIECVINDATMLNPSWIGRFDLVICDVPCSGFGVKGKPDILVNRKEQDIEKLAALQSEILAMAANYVSKGGILCYSTCTIFKEENEDIVESFLSSRPNFCLEQIKSEYLEEDGGMINLYPQKYGSDGFFIARMKKN